jgi:hypothetical protein
MSERKRNLDCILSIKYISIDDIKNIVDRCCSDDSKKNRMICELALKLNPDIYNHELARYLKITPVAVKYLGNNKCTSNNYKEEKALAEIELNMLIQKLKN